MRRRRKSAGDEAEVDMTPMLDIVFIMLIFFIVTATFLDETGLDLTQPPPPPESLDPPPPKPAITVYVNAQNLCSVDSERSECSRVPAVVESALAEKPNANIILKVHEAASHNNLVFMKDSFDGAGLDTKLEIINENAS